jgi:hypothetical protein
MDYWLTHANRKAITGEMKNHISFSLLLQITITIVRRMRSKSTFHSHTYEDCQLYLLLSVHCPLVEWIMHVNGKIWVARNRVMSPPPSSLSSFDHANDDDDSPSSIS